MQASRSVRAIPVAAIGLLLLGCAQGAVLTVARNEAGRVSTKYANGCGPACLTPMSWLQPQPPTTGITVNTSWGYNFAPLATTTGCTPGTVSYSLIGTPGTGFSFTGSTLSQAGTTASSFEYQVLMTCSDPDVEVASPTWIASSQAVVGGDVTGPAAPSCSMSTSILTCSLVSDESGIANYKLYTRSGVTDTLRATEAVSVSANPTLTPVTFGSVSGGTGVSGTGTTRTINSLSGDMGNTRTADDMHATCADVSGDATISVRVTDFNKLTGNYPKAGIGLFADDASGQVMVSQVVYPEGTNGIATEYRTSTGAAGLQTGGTFGLTYPFTVQLSYAAATNTATGSYDNGSGTVTNSTLTSVALPDVKKACVFLASRSENLTATFENITITAAAAPTFDISAIAACDSGCDIVVAAEDGAANLGTKTSVITYTVDSGGIMPGTRDPLEWPFSRESIWNTPIGSGAVYTDANIPATYSDVWVKYLFGDDEIIVMDAAAPQISIYQSTAGWSGVNRCAYTSPQTTVRSNVPWPSDFVIPHSGGNSQAAILLADGDTIHMSQPLAKCDGFAYATSYPLKWSESILGGGRSGSHGGSGLSSIGGSLRVATGDLLTQAPTHVLKMDFAEMEMSACNETSAGCGRWPAYYGETTGYGLNDPDPPVDSQLLMGALMAIKPDVDCENIGLETQPGEWLCWTLQNYGAYVVDTTPELGGMGIATDWTPEYGKFKDVFFSTWGYTFEARVRNINGTSGVTQNPWGRDMAKIAVRLHVVSNNSSTSVGGGGVPRQLLAPNFAP